MAAPIFSGPFAASFAEGQVAYLIPIDVTATGDGTGSVEGAGITYAALDPATSDNQFFSIDTVTGEITFLQPPDFETPRDANHDNTYVVSVIATDAMSGMSTVQQITITVTDSSSDPIITTPNAVTVSENQTLVLDVNSERGPNGGSSAVESDGLGYFIVDGGGADGALFFIDPDTGVLSFNVAPDFQHPADANGDNIYNVTIASQNYNSSTAGVTYQNITVTVVQGVPNATPVFDANVNPSGNEDTVITGSVHATDADVNDILAYSVVNTGMGAPAHGTVSINGATGAYSYTPATNYNGGDSFTVTVSDGQGGTATQVVSVSIAPVNDAPVVAAALTNQASPEDTALSFSIPAGTFTDVDNATLALSATLADGSALPTWLAFDPSTGTFSGTPPLDFNGDVGLLVTATDAGNLSASSAFTLTITPVNDSPFNVFELPDQNSPANTEFRYVIPGGTFYDVDIPTGDRLTYTATMADGSPLPTWLNFSDVQTPQFFGTPPQDFTGSLVFNVIATDTGGLSVSTKLFLTIEATNTAPVFDAVVNPTGNEDTAITSSVHATDANAGDVLLYSIALGNAPAHGTVTLNSATGDYTYNPAANYNGGDTFTVTVSDGHGGTATQAVGVTINAVNDAPVAVNDTGAAGENEIKVFNLLANDTDVDNTAAQLTLQSFAVTSATGGIVLSSAQAQAAFSIVGNQLRFAPGTIFDALSPGQNETVTGSYVVRDPGGATSTATFTLTVAGALDTITGTAANNTLNGTAGADLISGLGGNDTLNGNAGNDTLNGGAGTDTLNGGAGNDILIGGPGLDTLNGGLGADTFQFVAGDSPGGNTRGTGDLIQDFNRAQGDKIDISTIDANTLVAGVQNFTLVEFHTVAQGVATTGNDAGKIVLQSANGVTTVFLHTNNDGVADFTFQLTGTQTAASHLVITDFIL